MKPLAEDFDTEVNLQTPLLQGLSKKFDATDRNYMKVNHRLTRAIAKTKVRVLQIIIFIELALILAVALM